MDARADQYAFCVALHEALYGTLPQVSEGTEQRALPSRRGVPNWLRAILERGTDPDPEKRFASMGELLSRLQVGARRTRRRVVFGIVLAGSASAWALHAATTPTPCRDVGRSVEAVWHGDVATELEQALSATGSPLADSTSSRVLPVLDEYAARWSTQRREACEATRIRGEQSEALHDRRVHAWSAGARSFGRSSTSFVRPIQTPSSTP